MIDATPDAICVWPMFDFIEPSEQRCVAVLAVGREQGLRLDRVAQRGAGAVAVDDVHFGRFETARWRAPGG